jgi:hypothetical protein
MWQVAGGHGTIDVKRAVNEMKLYAFAGLGVFDMADICKKTSNNLFRAVYV